MTEDAPLFEYSRTGFKFAVYPGRIEILEGGFSKKASTILTRSITSVSVEGFGKAKLRVELGGKKHEWLIGRDADQARLAVLAAIG